MKTVRFLSMALGTVMLAGVLAGPVRADGWIDHRQARQQARIDQGIASGQLTAAETARLEREQARIDRSEGRALANDGRIGPRERWAIDRAQNHASRDIYRLKHNGWRR